MSESIRKNAETRMTKSVENLSHELQRLRTGRASVGLLDHIKVDYYGTTTPVNQMATVSVSDARTLLVAPWDKSTLGAVEKAIRDSDLGLNPATAGETIRVPLPVLTEERRKEMRRVVRAEGEHGKVAIRNIRRDAIHQLKELKKERELAEDEEKRAEESIQRLTDQFIAQVDELVSVKEKDLMEI